MMHDSRRALNVASYCARIPKRISFPLPCNAPLAPVQHIALVGAPIVVTFFLIPDKITYAIKQKREEREKKIRQCLTYCTERKKKSYQGQ